jgi:uncharacterized protein
MFNEIVSAALGLMVGLYASFVGTSGGSAIMAYLLLVLHVFSSQTKIVGTMLFISLFPLGIFGMYDYYKNKQIDYYLGLIITLGICVGIYMGSKYTFYINKWLGEKNGDKIKFGLTAIIYAILTVLYVYQIYK